MIYSNIYGGYVGQGNINADPSFVKEGVDYHLRGDSPCINAGTITDVTEEDIDGDERPAGADVDMGFDEYVPNEH